MRQSLNAFQVKSNVGKDPLRLQNQELDSALQQLDKQKTRAKLDREKFMLERPGEEEEEKPKR